MITITADMPPSRVAHMIIKNSLPLRSITNGEKSGSRWKNRVWIIGIISLLLSMTSQAESILVCEVQSGKVLYAEKAEKQRPVASLTKIASAVLTLDWMKRTGIKGRTLIPVPETQADLTSASPMKLYAGEWLTLDDALKASLISSDNMAAETLSSYVGSKLTEARGEKEDARGEFIREMNALAQSLEMHDTYFANPHGLDNAKERGYSTAADLMKLCQYALKNTQFRKITALQTASVKKRSNDKAESFTLKNTNPLLGQDGFSGIKTGETKLAGGCLASYCKRKRGQMICIVLGAKDRASTTRAAINTAEVKLTH